MLAIETRPIRAAETYELRHRILRPHDPLSLRAPSDTEPGTLHIRSFLNGQPIGVGSIVPEPRDHIAQPTSWRVRGMAVLEDARGIGAGGKILRALIDHASTQSLPAEIWCPSVVCSITLYPSNVRRAS
ncbi:MAG: GNAT family N-acetyltransferase [Ktedonobacteraceae bacterium]